MGRRPRGYTMVSRSSRSEDARAKKLLPIRRRTPVWPTIYASGSKTGISFAIILGHAAKISQKRKVGTMKYREAIKAMREGAGKIGIARLGVRIYCRSDGVIVKETIRGRLSVDEENPAVTYSDELALDWYTFSVTSLFYFDGTEIRNTKT